MTECCPKLCEKTHWVAKFNKGKMVSLVDFSGTMKLLERLTSPILLNRISWLERLFVLNCFVQNSNRKVLVGCDKRVLGIPANFNHGCIAVTRLWFNSIDIEYIWRTVGSVGSKSYLEGRMDTVKTKASRQLKCDAILNEVRLIKVVTRFCFNLLWSKPS